MSNLLRPNVSLWIETSEATNYPLLLGRTKVDVAVIGAGIAGLTTAYLLKQAGAMVAVLDGDRVCSGVTAYTTAKLTALHGLTYARLASRQGAEAAHIYAAANQSAIELVEAIVGRLGIDCQFERRDAYTYTLDPGRVRDIEAEVQAARLAGLPADYTESTDLPFAIMGAVRVTNQAMFHPRRYCLALAAALPGDGSHVFEATRALDVIQTRPLTVITNRGKLRADRVVIATHLPFLDRGGFFAKTSPSRSYALAARLLRPPPRGLYLSADSPVRSVRPALDDRYAILGGESHKVGGDGDTRRHFVALEQWAREHFDIEAIDYRWSAQDYMPVDDLPYIGRMPRSTHRLLVATGFRKWGMTLGTVAGMLLADAILGRDNPWRDLFDSTRIDVVYGARRFFGDNAEVARRYIGDRFATRTPLAQLQPGEAAIVEHHRKRIAAYREPDGQLHTVSPVCTHMGCLVRWNAAEVSWDCPCHGSRFDPDGTILHGPAIESLPAIRVEQAPG